LVATQITITNGTGQATRGALTGAGMVRTLAISNVVGGTITVSINSPGIANLTHTVTLEGPSAPPISGARVQVTGIPATHNGRIASVVLQPVGVGANRISTMVTITSGSVTVGFPDGITAGNYNVFLRFEAGGGHFVSIFSAMGRSIGSALTTIPWSAFN